ncbi:MAG: ABC transporter ATP-binding protein [Acidimicrobiales bacterium]|nr:ABC transporter ATP-binding protein [Acidimicrobiales bacterium]MDP6298024.1 ABC transporter ATP-binding protein [Acidimicrobiales bacterium]
MQLSSTESDGLSTDHGLQKIGVIPKYDSPKNSIHPNKDLGWMRRLVPIARSHRRPLLTGIVVGTIALVLNVAVPAVAREAIDSTIGGDQKKLTTWAIILICVGLGRFVAGALYRISLFRVAWGVETDLRALLYAHLTKLSFSYFDRTQSGQIISRANSDIRSIQVLLAFGPLIAMSIISFLLAFAFMMTLHVRLTLVALCTLPGVYFFGQKLRHSVFPLTWVSQARLAELATIVDENINGTRVVKSFAAEEHQIGLLQKAARHIEWVNVQAIKERAKFNPIIEALPRVGMAVVLLYGGLLAINDDVSIGTLFAFNAYVIMLQAPFRMFGFLLLQAQRASASATRIFEVLDENPEIVDSPEAVTLSQVRGEITFENVCFSYQNRLSQFNNDSLVKGSEIISNLDLSITPGETVAIVGRTGSGKSTVARLLTRFYDVDSGKICIDGRDIREIKLDSLRHHVGVVFDEPFLFSTSIAENISYGNPTASSAEIVNAAKSAQAFEFINDLSKGFETIVGERGYTLSGGQRQRIALARNLLEDPNILILDDATSAIDIQVESRIHDSLRNHLEGRTTLLIAQRISTIALADRVLLLDGGKIVDEGTHKSLMENNPLYTSILAEAETSSHQGGI